MLSGASTRIPAFSRRVSQLGDQPIADLMTKALARPELISLAAGFVDNETLPVDIASDVIQEFLADQETAKSALQYGSNAGDPVLRQAILDRWYDSDQFTAEQVVIGPGSNQLLYMLTEILLDPGDIVLCASPTYLVFLGIVGGVGGRAVGIATDESGMIPESLDEQLAQFDQAGELHRVKAIYLVPYHDNPSARTMPWERKFQIAEVARKWSVENPIFMLMDTAYQDLNYDEDEVPRLQASETDSELLVEIGTFSKCFSPGLRVGWTILPQLLQEPFLKLKGNLDFGSPNLAQQVAAGVLTRNRLQPHLDQLRTQYMVKRDAMLDAMDEHLSDIDGLAWAKPSGGLYVWLTLPEALSAGPEGPLLLRALDEGVLYVPGQYCFSREGAEIEENTIRLSFGVQPAERIQNGIEALGRAVRK